MDAKAKANELAVASRRINLTCVDLAKAIEKALEETREEGRREILDSEEVRKLTRYAEADIVKDPNDCDAFEHCDDLFMGQRCERHIRSEQTSEILSLLDTLKSKHGGTDGH